MGGKEQYDSIFRLLQSEGNRSALVIEKTIGGRPALSPVAYVAVGMQFHQFLY